MQAFLHYSGVGFEHSDYNSPCTPVDGHLPFLPVKCTNGDYYNISNGYVNSCTSSNNIPI